MTTRQLPSAVVTDQVVKNELDRFGIPYEKVDFTQDYGGRRTPAEIRRLGGRGPYNKFYTLQDNSGNIKKGTKFMVSQGLPMANRQGDLLVPEWVSAPARIFRQETNLFDAVVDGLDVTLTVLDDQPTGIKANDQLIFHPQVFLNGVEIKPKGVTGKLLDTDPINQFMHFNVIEWDFGICKRLQRNIPGKAKGYWIFETNPGGDVLFRYNQSGDFRLKLGPFRLNEDEEFIPKSYFDNPDEPWEHYPLLIQDTLTVYPDEHIETASVDGRVRDDGVNQTWAQLNALTGSLADDDGIGLTSTWQEDSSTDRYQKMYRGSMGHDTSPLGAGSTISAATESLYGNPEWTQRDDSSNTPTFNIYASSPNSNTALVGGDFDGFGAVAFCDTPLAYASINEAGYNDFAFNASGLSAISKTATSNFGLREASFEITGTPPTWGADNRYTQFAAYAAEKGAGYKPKLVVTYTPAGGVPVHFMDRQRRFKN